MNPGTKEEERGPAPKKRWKPLDSPDKDKGSPPGEVGGYTLELLQPESELIMLGGN